VDRAEAPGTSERIGPASALFRLADVRRAQGNIEASDVLKKRAFENEPCGLPEPESQAGLPMPKHLSVPGNLAKLFE